VWLLLFCFRVCVCDRKSHLSRLTHLLFIIISDFVHFCHMAFFLGMSNFVFSLLICHSELLLVRWGERKVLQPHPSAPYNPLVNSFDFVLLCSFVFCHVLSHVSNYFTVISLPSIPRCSVSSGLNIAPAHTSARHEAVRVWLESMSGGSSDFSGIMASRLRLVLLSVYRLAFFWSMQKHVQSKLTSMHAARLSLSRVLLSWDRISTCI